MYVVAGLCEMADASPFEALGVMSGHTLKHMLALAAACVLARQNLTR